MSEMNKRVVKLALPNIITNITVPLLGMVDLAIVGHIGDQTHIGAIAIGTTIFNFIYWNFGFLRMGTSGFTAQAYGAKNLKESINILVRGCTLALTFALLLIILQIPISRFSFWIVDGSSEMEKLAYDYFKIRIWAAPATLGLYAFKGWYIGMQNSKTPMFIAIFINLFNIAFSLFFVIVLGMQIEGVAWGTLLAQWCGLIAAIVYWLIYYKKLSHYINLKAALHLNELKYFFRVNGDIFLRSLCLVIVFTFIPIAGANMGDDILAINTLLLQYFTIFSYMMDGFAYAGESLAGKYIGAKDIASCKLAVKNIFSWGTALTIAFTLIYILWGEDLLILFTDKKDIIASAHPYYYWICLVPIAGFSAFLWDGILIGATAGKIMRNCIFIATACFFACYYALFPSMHNHALWLALLIFLILRGVLQHYATRKYIYPNIA